MNSVVLNILQKANWKVVATVSLVSVVVVYVGYKIIGSKISDYFKQQSQNESEDSAVDNSNVAAQEAMIIKKAMSGFTENEELVFKTLRESKDIKAVAREFRKLYNVNMIDYLQKYFSDSEFEEVMQIIRSKGGVAGLSYAVVELPQFYTHE